jgi:tricorn protease
VLNQLLLTTIVTIQVATVSALEVTPPLLIDGLALTNDVVVFSYAGDLWRVPREGGAAERLTQTPYDERFPHASPDGNRIAYSGEATGDWNVFVLDLDSGESEQWTYHPKTDIALGWSPDGTRVLFTSGRFGDMRQRLCTIGENDPLPEVLPLPMGFRGAFAPDGDRLVYAPVGWEQEFVPYRYYRGGMTSPMWITDLRDGSVDVVYGNASNHMHFVWQGNTIFFTGDDTGTYNVYAHDVESGEKRMLTNYDDYGVDYLAVRGDTIAYVQGGRIHLQYVSSDATNTLAISLEIDATQREPRTVEARRWLTDAHADESGETVALTARGDVFLYKPESGNVENLTNTPGIAERGATLSPDGKRGAYFSDRSGEYQLIIHTIGGDEKVIDIESSPSFYRQLTWSPDGRWIAFTGKRLGLWLADTGTAAVEKIDESNYLAQDLFHPDWSPDSRYVAYHRGNPNHQHDVVLYDTETKQRHQLTSDVDATHATFDRNCKYLYYLSGDTTPMTAANQVWGLLSAIQAAPITKHTVHAAVLRETDPAPYWPGSTKANDAAQVNEPVKKFQIDLDGLSDRVVPLPVPPRDYTGMTAASPGVIYLDAQTWNDANGGPRSAMFRVDLSERPSLRDELTAAAIHQRIGDGSKTLLLRGTTLYLESAADEDAERLDYGDLDIELDPSAEWAQLYREAWRLMRDYFYDAHHHGQDLAKLEADYAEYLPSITRRSDLTALFRKMLGHISISHMGIGGGDTEASETESLRIGLLGADFAVDNGAFRIEKIYRRAPAYHGNGLAVSAPLDQPGLDIREGDYLIEVNGKRLETSQNLYAQLAGLASEETKIVVSGNPEGKDARAFTVVPLSGDNGLQRANWDMENRARVEELSDGTIGYVTMPEFGMASIDSFVRQVVAASGKDGIVIDQRFNGGGITSDTLVHLLTQPPLHAYDYPHGEDFAVSPVGFHGPKVLLVNEQNFSAAETFPLMFDIAETGAIVGMRTGGGGTGTALHYPELIDGGHIGIPNRAGYNPRTGEWAENTGVAPDVEVQWMPADYQAGRDPQLERAVAIAMERAKTEPKYEPKQPAYVEHP